MKPSSKTVKDFLAGTNVSEFSFYFRRFPNLLGSWDGLNEAQTSRVMKSLCEERKLFEIRNADGTIVYSLERQTTRERPAAREVVQPSRTQTTTRATQTSSHNESAESQTTTLYWSCPQYERVTIDEFKRLCGIYLPRHEFKDAQNWCGYISRSSVSGNRTVRVWLSKNGDERRLTLHYRREEGGRENKIILSNSQVISAAWDTLRSAFGN